MKHSRLSLFRRVLNNLVLLSVVFTIIVVVASCDRPGGSESHAMNETATVVVGNVTEVRRLTETVQMIAYSWALPIICALGIIG